MEALSWIIVPALSGFGLGVGLSLMEKKGSGWRGFLRPIFAMVMFIGGIAGTAHWVAVDVYEDREKEAATALVEVAQTP